MADPTQTISNVNEKIMGSFGDIQFMNILGWIGAGILIIGVVFWAYIYYRDKKVFSKIVTAFEIVGVNFVPAIRDTAKVVKLGSGGFEILFLKKSKTWKVGYGGRVGKNTYYFFIMPDGYWYNAMLYASMFMIDKLGGLIPVVTTNPSMRSQYTALEKQIDAMHAQKKTFWQEYGAIALYAGLILLTGFMMWWNFKEFSSASGNLNVVADKFGIIADKMNLAMDKINANPANSGLIPVK